MKKCSFCAEEIQDEAIKCKHCGSMLNSKQQEKWYLRISVLVIALLSIGPFALPLLWLNPRFSNKVKLALSLIVIVVTYFLVVVFSNSTQAIYKYYQQILQGS